MVNDNSDHNKWLKCEIAEHLLEEGFNQNYLRFSLCYANFTKFQFSGTVPFFADDKSILLYGIFPITSP